MLGFKTLFSADKAVDTATNIINKGMSGLDALVFTKEERSEFVKDFVLKMQDTYGPRALSRRIIAIMTLGSFNAAFITALVFACFDKLSVVMRIIEVIKAFGMPWIVGTIIIFYFGYYGIGGILAFSKKKK